MAHDRGCDPPRHGCRSTDVHGANPSRAGQISWSVLVCRHGRRRRRPSARHHPAAQPCGFRAVAMACFDHRIFIKYHFDELRLKKWLDGAMHVFQIHSPERGGIRVHGTIITDSNMDLIAYCVENKPSASLQIRGNRTKTVEAIKKLCRYESWSTRV